MSETHGHHPPWPPAPPLRTDTVSKPPRVRSKRGADSSLATDSEEVKGGVSVVPALVTAPWNARLPSSPPSDADLIPDPPSRSRRRDEDVVWGDVENFLI